MTFTDDEASRQKSFSDSDLKWWKKEHQSPMSKALLARLEAAEKVITMQRHICPDPDDTGDDDRCTYCLLKADWRKLKGEGE